MITKSEYIYDECPNLIERTSLKMDKFVEPKKYEIYDCNYMWKNIVFSPLNTFIAFTYDIQYKEIQIRIKKINNFESFEEEAQVLQLIGFEYSCCFNHDETLFIVAQWNQIRIFQLINNRWMDEGSFVLNSMKVYTNIYNELIVTEFNTLISKTNIYQLFLDQHTNVKLKINQVISNDLKNIIFWEDQMIGLETLSNNILIYNKTNQWELKQQINGLENKKYQQKIDSFQNQLIIRVISELVSEKKFVDYRLELFKKQKDGLYNCINVFDWFYFQRQRLDQIFLLNKQTILLAYFSDPGQEHILIINENCEIIDQKFFQTLGSQIKMSQNKTLCAINQFYNSGNQKIIDLSSII